MIITGEKQNSGEQVQLKGYLLEFRTALEEEIDKIKKSGQSSILLYSGRKIESHGPEHWYCFNVEYAPSLPADTPCKLLIGRDAFDVTVISFEENSIIISSKVLLPDTIANARLDNGATVLMERLIKCIEQNALIKNSAGERMLPPDGGVYSAQSVFTYNDLVLNSNNTESQNNAIKSALSYDIAYIWGPPGTGKTTVIGQIIDELYKHNRSVLVVSHTNTAVDGAIEKVDDYYKDKYSNNDSAYPILRIGVPARPLPNRVLLDQHVESLGRELFEQNALLEKQQSELQYRIDEILPMLAKYKWVNDNKLDQIRETLQNIAGYTEIINEIQHDIEKIKEAIELEKAAYPEYGKYLILSKIIEAKRADYNSVSNQIKNSETTAKSLPSQIQHVQDEIKKHNVYAELKSEEARFMSEQFLRDELAKIGIRITLLSKEIADLRRNLATAQKIIEDYENKSSLARLFSGKKDVKQAQTRLQEIIVRLPEAEIELQRQHNLEQVYKGQLESLLVLQDQIRAVIPSRTQNYWNTELQSLQSNLVAIENTLPNLKSQRDSLYEELYNLEQKQSQAKESFNKISEFERALQQKLELLENTKDACNQASKSCSENLERECDLCSEFYYNPTFEDTRQIFDELSNLLASVRSEISDVDINSLRQEKVDADSQLLIIHRQINENNQKMQELEEQAIMNAKIVGATLAKSYLSETLRKRKFDTVILDEASMAPIPALWCASYLAESSIVIVGDFLQLPPIVMAETPMAKKWLGKDIFYISGMQERAKSKETCPNNFVMLNDQFRMESDIANIANMYYGEYGGLVSHDEKRASVREKFYGWYSGRRTKSNIHLIDTESLHAWVTGVPQGRGHSRLNCFSAAVDVDLAFKFLENKLNALDPADTKPEKDASVLIVAPYKPHITRINQLIDLEYRSRGFKENLNFIRAGTIHSFQGSEADIVIFDLVIDEPHWKANLFMTDKEVNEDLRKMFNVAVTRAKFKLFIVGNFSYCQKRAKNNALSELLDKLLKKSRLVKTDAKKLLPNITFSKPSLFAFGDNLSGKHIVCREDSFNDYFMADVLSFQKRLIIYSPFMTEARLGLLLPSFTDAVNEGKQIIIVTKAASDRGKKELPQYQKCEKELRDIGVSILHKKGMHEKLIFVDREAVWIGSLNALSFTGLTGEVMQRHEDKELVSEYEKIFDIEHICKAIENIYEQICPICGSEMLVRESDDGGIYWQCVEGDYSRDASQQYPLDGILRCKCGAPYKFAMKNEPRWVCTNDSKHFQKMRESDLKLKKMAELIPTKAARKEVDKFFAQKRKEREAKKRKSTEKGRKSP